MELPFGEGRLVLETGEIGRLAAGAVVASDGDTVVYSTCCADRDPGDYDFTPLSVEFQERSSAGGRTSGSFKRRDMKRDFETLNARLIDRPLRPLFPAGWRHDTQVLNWVLSFDGERLAEPLAITAAGAAVALSDVPVPRAVAGVRVGLDPAGEGPSQFLVNPSRTQMQASALDLVVAGTRDGVLMLEGGGDFVPDDVMAEAVRVGAAAVAEVCRGVDAWAEKVGKAKRAVTPEGGADGGGELLEAMGALLGSELAEAMAVREKKARGAALTACQGRVKAELETQHPGRWTDAELSAAFKDLNSRETREMARRGERSDGRGPDDVRPIATRASVLPRTHGSALFTRGETQVLATATLGDKYSALKVEDLVSCEEDSQSKTFYLQYAFPPSSVGETGRMGAPGRREVGHGNLAERALLPVVPSAEDFPYVIRVESLVTESNGSSSMASVCGGCLAMQDAGVPISRPVAGVAMGLVLGEGGEGGGGDVILTDILGSEDALGDMDFKVAGDAEGITAFQMDIKVEGVSPETVEEALRRAREGRLHILGEMARCDPPPRKRLGGGAPVIKMTRVDPKLLGSVIGPKGANVLKIIEKFKLEDVQCNYDPKQPGLIQVVGSDEENVNGAVAYIQSSVEVPEAGAVYRGCLVKSVKDFGCFVEILPGKEALCHISELSAGHTKKVTDVCDVGDVIDVKVLELRDNKVRVSKRAADAETAGALDS